MLLLLGMGMLRVQRKTLRIVGWFATRKTSKTWVARGAARAARPTIRDKHSYRYRAAMSGAALAGPIILGVVGSAVLVFWLLYIVLETTHLQPRTKR